MAEQDRPEDVCLHDERFLEVSQPPSLPGIEFIMAPPCHSIDLGYGALGAVPVGHLSVGISSQEQCSVPEIDEALDRGARHWSPGDVASNHDDVGLAPIDLGEDRFERREVAVDVVEGRNSQWFVTVGSLESRRAS